MMGFQQLDLFTFEEKKEKNIHTIHVGMNKQELLIGNVRSVKLSPHPPTAAIASWKKSEEFSVTNISTEHLPTNSIVSSSIEAPKVTAYKAGDVVRINMPNEEDNSEVYWYLKGYYSHLLEAKGRIKRILPYKKLQYEVEFDVKDSNNTIFLHHEHLQ